MKLEFCSLSSGSSGNCYYLGTETTGILIDAGISARNVLKYLKELNVSIDKIMGVLITHNHHDHIKGLQTLTYKHNLPAYTTETVWENILKHSRQNKITSDCIRKIVPQQKFNLAGFEIEAFPVSHDTPETLGFHICYGNRKITIVTDLGHICSTAATFISAANFLVIESNYDEQMLKEGAYPYFLKERILSNHGHLDNEHTSSFLSENINSELSHICLAHLSRDNNSPEIALKTLQGKLLNKGLNNNNSPIISVLKRNIPSELICLDE